MTQRLPIILFLLLLLAGGGLLWWLWSTEKSELMVTPEVADEATVSEEPSTAVDTAPNPYVQDFDTSQVDTARFQYSDEGFIPVSWLDLKKVRFEERMNEEINAYVAYPEFHPEVRFLEGKRIQIEGFYIPTDETGDTELIVISAFPYSNCFFCGGAGPESVMDIQMREPLESRVRKDTKLTFRGRLRLNDSDLYYLNYILEDAVLVE